MALLLRSDGQGNPGDAVTNANSSGPDQFTSALVSGAGNTLQYAVVAGFNGGGAVQATIGAVAGAGYVTWSFTAVTTAYSRIYAKFASLPSSNTRLIAYTDTAGAALRAGLYIDTAGHLITVDSAGSTVATSTSTVTAGSVFRVELDTTGNAGAGVVTCRLYLTPGSATASETLNNTGLATGGTIGQIWVGSSDAASTNTAPAVGDLQVNDSGPVGPASLRMRNNTAEGQTSGTALTTGNSGGGSGDAYDSVSKGVAGAAAFDNAQFMHGTQSYHVTGGATDTAIMIYSGASDTAASIRFYVRFNTLPSSAQTLMAIRNGTGFAATFGVSATNKFTVGNAAGTVLSTFTTTLSTGVWYRCEMEAVVGTLITTGTIAGRYFLGDATTAQDTPYTSGVVNSGVTSFTNGRFGKQTAAGTGFDVWIDDTGFTPGFAVPLGPSVVSTGAAVAEVDTVTAAGVVGAVTAATVTPNDAITTTGVVGASTTASVTETDTIASTGVVGVSSSAAVSPNDTIVSAGLVGVTTTAAVNPVDTITTAGLVGAATGAAVTTADTVTAVGVAGARIGAAVTVADTIVAAGTIAATLAAAPVWTLTITADGVVAVIVPGLAGNIGYIGEGPMSGAVAYDVPRSMIGGIDN